MYASEKLYLHHGSSVTEFTGNWQGCESIKTVSGGAVKDDNITVYIFDTSLEASIGDKIMRENGEQMTIYSIERNITASPRINHICVKGA